MGLFFLVLSSIVLHLVNVYYIIRSGKHRTVKEVRNGNYHDFSKCTC